MEENFESAFRVDYGLPAKEKKRYAKAKQTFELGIWGHPFCRIFSIFIMFYMT